MSTESVPPATHYFLSYDTDAVRLGLLATDAAAMARLLDLALRGLKDDERDGDDVLLSHLAAALQTYTSVVAERYQKIDAILQQHFEESKVAKPATVRPLRAVKGPAPKVTR